MYVMVYANALRKQHLVGCVRLYTRLGRALGHFIFSLIGLKRILLSNIFQRL